MREPHAHPMDTEERPTIVRAALDLAAFIVILGVLFVGTLMVDAMVNAR